MFGLSSEDETQLRGLKQVYETSGETPEERFNKYVGSFCADENKDLLEKIKPHKKRIIESVHKYGPAEAALCDCLVYLCDWLRTQYPEDVKVRNGSWAIHEAGGTEYVSAVIPGTAGLCPADMPNLKNPDDNNLAERMSNHLVASIIKGCRLSRSTAPWPVQPDMGDEEKGGQEPLEEKSYGDEEKEKVNEPDQQGIQLTSTKDRPNKQVAPAVHLLLPLHLIQTVICHRRRT